MVFKKKNYVRFIYCGCGCQKTLPRNTPYGHRRKYIVGHQKPWLGKKMSDEVKKKMGESRKGERNGCWKGKEVGRTALHDWVKLRFPKSEHPICMLCNINPSEQLANITGIYERDLKNWAYFCVKCHMEYDNILERTILLANRKKHEKALERLKSRQQN